MSYIEIIEENIRRAAANEPLPSIVSPEGAALRAAVAEGVGVVRAAATQETAAVCRIALIALYGLLDQITQSGIAERQAAQAIAAGKKAS